MDTAKNVFMWIGIAIVGCCALHGLGLGVHHAPTAPVYYYQPQPQCPQVPQPPCPQQPAVQPQAPQQYRWQWVPVQPSGAPQLQQGTQQAPSQPMDLQQAPRGSGPDAVAQGGVVNFFEPLRRALARELEGDAPCPDSWGDGTTRSRIGRR